VRYWFLWPLLLVAAGVVVSHVLLQKYALNRRRSLAQDALQDAVNEYCAERRRLDARQPTPKVWDLDDVIDCGSFVDESWRSFQNLDTSGRIAAALVQARSDGDLDEAAAAVLALRIRVTSWLLILTCVDDLEKLRDQQQPPNHATQRWDATRVAMDTRSTLDAAEQKPTDAAAAAALQARIRRQLEWRQAYVRAWTLYGELEERAKGDKAKLKQLDGTDFGSLDQFSTPAAARTAEQQSEMLYKLAAAYGEMRRIAGAETPALPRSEPNRRAASLAAELAHLQRNLDRPQFAFATAGQVRPRGEDAGDEPANEARGDQAGVGQAARRARGVLAKATGRDEGARTPAKRPVQRSR
jgi:hypothetical protein